jgi:hypothetical protein
MGKSLGAGVRAAALATGGSIQATIDTRRTPGDTRASGLTETTKATVDIEDSLRWHDPDRFNGFDLSPLNAGTPVASCFAAKAVELSMEIPAALIGPRGRSRRCNVPCEANVANISRLLLLGRVRKPKGGRGEVR